MRPKMSLRQTMLVESMHLRKLGNSNLQRKRRRNCLAQNCPGLLKRGFETVQVMIQRKHVMIQREQAFPKPVGCYYRLQMSPGRSRSVQMVYRKTLAEYWEAQTMELLTKLVARWVKQTLRAEMTAAQMTVAEMLAENRRELTKGAAWKLEVSPKTLNLEVGTRLSVT